MKNELRKLQKEARAAHKRHKKSNIHPAVLLTQIHELGEQVHGEKYIKLLNRFDNLLGEFETNGKARRKVKKLRARIVFGL